MQSEEEQPTKRRRIRHSVACDACKVRKSRCELVTAAGCHRCSVLRTPCSLTITGSTSDKGSTPTPVPQDHLSGASSRRSSTLNGNATRGSASSRSRPASNPVSVSPAPHASPLDRDQVVAAIAEIRDYTARIEVLSSSVMAAISAPVESPRSQMVAGPSSRSAQQYTQHQSIPLLSRYEYEHQHRQSTVSPPGQSTVSPPIREWSTSDDPSVVKPSHTDPAALLHYTCQGSDDPDIADFTARAPFTQGVIQGALDRFAQAFYRIMPIPHFRDPAVYQHPPLFLKTCMLYFIACSSSPDVPLDNLQRQTIFQATDRAVLDLPCLPPDRDTVLALLILSMAPAQPQSRFLRVMDPYNASVLAWNTIKSLGMDQVLQEHRADRQSTTLFFERPDRLLQLCLLYSVIHRHRQSMFDTTPSLSVVAVEYPDLATIVSWRDAETLQSPWLIHLLVQSTTLREIEAKSVHYRALRQSATLDRKAIDMVCEQMETLDGGYRNEDVMPSIPSSSYLRLDILCSDAIIFQKVNWDLETLTLPEEPGKTGLSGLRVARVLYVRAVEIVRILAADRTELSELPSRLLSVAFLAFTTIAQVRVLHRMIPGEDDPGGLSWAVVSAAREVLLASHQAAPVIIKRIESPLPITAAGIEKGESESPLPPPRRGLASQYPSAQLEQDARFMINPLCLDDIPEDWMTLFGSGVLEAPAFWTGQTPGT